MKMCLVRGFYLNKLLFAPLMSLLSAEKCWKFGNTSQIRLWMGRGMTFWSLFAIISAFPSIKWKKKTITKSIQVKLEQESNISMSFSRLVEAIGKLQFHWVRITRWIGGKSVNLRARFNGSIEFIGLWLSQPPHLIHFEWRAFCWLLTSPRTRMVIIQSHRTS